MFLCNYLIADTKPQTSTLPTLPLLQNRAENQPDEQIREIVKQKLQQ